MSELYDAEGTIQKARNATQLPTPVGYTMLVALPAVNEKTAGGIIRPDDLRSKEETAAVVGWVMTMGPECYTDKRVFTGEPWCKQGDWVLFRPYTGMRIVVHGQEFRLLKDVEVCAVVENPAGIIRSQKV